MAARGKHDRDSGSVPVAGDCNISSVDCTAAGKDCILSAADCESSTLRLHFLTAAPERRSTSLHLVGRRPVNSWHLRVQEPQIHAQLSPVMNSMVQYPV